MLNVTVEDVDDSMPVFIYTDSGSSDCVVPVYRADTSEEYLVLYLLVTTCCFTKSFILSSSWKL